MPNPPGAPEGAAILPPLSRPPVRRVPYLTHDIHGDPPIMRPIVNVPLPSGGAARITLDDFNEKLMQRGWSDQMHLHSNGRKHAYVRGSSADVPGHIVTIARLLTGGRKGTQVRYVNGDPTDLRPENLRVTGGYSRGREAAAMAQAGGATF